MRIQVVVCLYDRFENFRRWVHSWTQCDHTNARLTIVHNVDKVRAVSQAGKYCKSLGIGYIQRQNVGFETGVIQDVFLKKIKNIGQWDALLFCTDDTIPMRKNFLHTFRYHMQHPDVGVGCMEISGTWTPHIRTTGFCVKREVAQNIYWVHCPIVTKEQCYFFEHQGFEDTFMSQVLKMDKRVIQLSSIKESVLWDTDHHAVHNRMDEWRREFPGFQG